MNATFVIRVWVSTDRSTQPALLHGVVEHVGGSSRSFASDAELLEAIRSELARSEPRTEEER